MLRLKILVSTLPLILLGVVARSAVTQGLRPCIVAGETSVQIASAPWQAQTQTQTQVSFTSDPAAATVRVQIVDTAEAADFAVVDDVDGAEAGGCPVNAATRFVAIAAASSAVESVIYLSKEGQADYRIFVRSATFTPREAAALIVGAARARDRVAAALL